MRKELFNPAITAMACCDNKDFAGAKEALMTMCSFIQGKDDATIVLKTHKAIKNAEMEAQQKKSPFENLIHAVENERSQIKRAKLVLDAAMMLELVQVQKIFQLKMVRTLHPKIKEKFFVPELTEEPIFEEVLLPILRVSVGTRTEKIGEFPKSKKFVID